MRCLYCGKELALLKRWTGGGEFCSDAHRQRYQEEYNQLALNRLLQAKPPNDPQAAGSAKQGGQKNQAAVTTEPVLQETVREPNYGAPPPSALKISEPTLSKPVHRELSAPMVELEPEQHLEAAAYVQEQHVEEVVDEPAPAELAGFIVELPASALAEVATMSRPDLEFLAAGATALPDHPFDAANAHDEFQLGSAGLVSFPLTNQVLNYSTNGTRERRLEVREFLRTAPVVEVGLNPAGETGLETASETRDFSMSPQTPASSPVLWQEPPVPFMPGETDLGDLGRLAFSSTGFSDEPATDGPSDQGDESVEENAQPATGEVTGSEVTNEAPEKQQAPVLEEVLPEIAVAEMPVETAPELTRPSVEVHINLQPEALTSSFVTKAFRAPLHETPAEPVVETAAVEPVVEVAAETPVVEKTAEPPIEPVAEPALSATLELVTEQAVVENTVTPTPSPAPIPEAITTPAEVTVSSTAPSRGKTVQVFASAVSGIQAQVPRSTSLPLRPVMTFGPVPVKEPVKVQVKEVVKPVEKVADNKAALAAQVEAKQVEPKKAEPKKTTVAPAPVTTSFRRPFGDNQSKPAVAKEVKPDPKPEPKVEKPAPEPAKIEQVAKADTSKSGKQSAKPDLKPEKRQDVKELKVKEEVKQTSLPAPLSPPYPGSTSDLGLPRLSMQPSPGIWSRMPVAAKIGVAVVMLAAVGIVISMSSKSGSATEGGGSGGAGTVVAGNALPVGDAGWITDWGGEAGVRRSRQISVLRASQTFTDYRIEMQGQIETKAIGWVYRAADAKNFYVTKLEIVKPGLEPTIALVRFAVIGGEEQARAQLPLQMKVRRDTVFKIRFDAVGNHFTTYVQDEKVDDWTDDHVKTGGVGMYSERGEVASLKGGMRVIPLVVRR